MLPVEPMGKAVGSVAGEAVNRFPFLMGLVACCLPLAIGIGTFAIGLHVAGLVISGLSLALIGWVLVRRRAAREIDAKYAALKSAQNEP
jgi:hypothetical protein